jgi:hypothetical protein
MSNADLRASLVGIDQPLRTTSEAASTLFDPLTAASNAMDGLSTSADKIAASFGEMEFDTTAMWELARASGASMEALSELAIDLGIASNAEVVATTKAYALRDAFGEGKLTADEYRTAIERLASDIAHASEMEAQMAARSRIGTPGGGPAAHGYQHGTPYHPGGLAVVGENGAEVVSMPPGSAVYPNYSQTTQNVVNNTDNRRYSTTNNVSDALAAAMIMNQQRQQERARLNALM